MKRKVGISTVYTGLNYGSSLQAYASKVYLEHKGYEAEVLSHKEGIVKGRDIRIRKVAKMFLRTFWRPRLFKQTFLTYKRSLNKEIDRETKEAFLKFYEHKLKPSNYSWKELKQYAAQEQTLACICGSDQIWNATNIYIDPIFYLRFAPQHKRVAYAPSFGKSSVPDYNQQIIRKYIKDIPYISVREEQGTEIVKALIDREVVSVVDPTLLLTGEEWLSQIDDTITKPEQYILLYFLDNPSECALAYIKILQEQSQLPLVVIPYQYQAFDTFKGITYKKAGPEQFLDLVHNATFICTDSFHGTIFAVNFNRPFYSFQRDYGTATDQSSRIVSILDKLALQDRFITQTNKPEQSALAHVNLTMDFVKANALLEVERSNSKAYLDQALWHIEEGDKTPNTLVSIIVPAYNVAQYIEKCITSILQQTHTSIEVIVVNDGSTDNTGSIIDKMAQQDQRVVTVHKENAGVSAARNSGIEVSTGAYLVFVDGDDYIAADYVAYMLELMQRTNSDFCLSKACYTKRGERQTEKACIQTLTPEAATALLLSPEVIVGCWNKMFKRSLIVDNRMMFSTTLFYGEGLTFITTIAQMAQSVGVGNRKVYYYRRNNEASATTHFDVNKLYNGEKALQSIGEKLSIPSPKVKTMLKLHQCLFYLGALVRMKANGVDKTYLADYKRWKRYVRANVGKLIVSKDVSIYRKLMLIGGAISPWLMMKLDRVRRDKIVANSVD